MKPILMKSETGYILFGHGSSVESANDAVRAVAANFAQRGGHHAVETAFLEGGRPDLAGAVALLAGRGIADIVVIPYFLTLGTHLQRDLPKLVDEARAAHAGVQIAVTPPLDGHPALLEALADRANGK
jgi:sirohydrochlorin ferrochelatase